MVIIALEITICLEVALTALLQGDVDMYFYRWFRWFPISPEEL